MVTPQTKLTVHSGGRNPRSLLPGISSLPLLDVGSRLKAKVFDVELLAPCDHSFPELVALVAKCGWKRAVCAPPLRVHHGKAKVPMSRACLCQARPSSRKVFWTAGRAATVAMKRWTFSNGERSKPTCPAQPRIVHK